MLAYLGWPEALQEVVHHMPGLPSTRLVGLTCAVTLMLFLPWTMQSMMESISYLFPLALTLPSQFTLQMQFLLELSMHSRKE